jgi:hypothetical protein
MLPTGQLSAGVSGAGSQISSGMNSLNVGNEHSCDNVSNTNVITASCFEHLSAKPEKSHRKNQQDATM